MKRAGGRPRYTDEPITQPTASVLADVEQTLREDAAHHRITMTSLWVELSREYLDPEVHDRVLARAREGSRGKLLDGA